jgi:predicted nucleotidyltransferase
MTDEQIQKKAVNLLLNAAPSGSRVILFGSRATGRAQSDSDWDFLVVEPAVKDRFAEMARLSEILGKELIPADVLVMSKQAFDLWQTMPNSLPSMVREKGLVYESIS